MSKEIKFGVEGRAAMLKGVDTLADAVQVSLSFLEKIPEDPTSRVGSTAILSSARKIFDGCETK